MSFVDEERRLFLREAKDRPDDDVPRLILGDWLQDLGDPRGELVHLQVRRSRLHDNDPTAEEMLRRERLLLRQHALDWLGPLADFGNRWSFERGLIHLTATLERFTSEGGFPGVEAFDWVETLSLNVQRTPAPHALAVLVNLGVLRCVATLDLTGLVHLSPLPLLHEEARSLRTLLLTKMRLEDEHAWRLATSEHLAGLHFLDLSYNRIGDEGAHALAGSIHLAGLACLDVRSNPISPEALAVLRAKFGERVLIHPRGI